LKAPLSIEAVRYKYTPVHIDSGCICIRQHGRHLQGDSFKDPDALLDCQEP